MHPPPLSCPAFEVLAVANETESRTRTTSHSYLKSLLLCKPQHYGDLGCLADYPGTLSGRQAPQKHFPLIAKALGNVCETDRGK